MARRRRSAARKVVMVAASLLIAAGGLAFLTPFLRLPAPTGPYAVGSILLDVPRPASEPVTAQLWFPIDGAAGPVLPYRSGGGGLRYAYQRLVATETHSGGSLSAAETRYPVVLYFPGWGGARTDNTVQMQELASHGYVVVALDDPRPSDPAMDFSSLESYRRTVDTGETKVRAGAAIAGLVLDALARLDRDDPSGRFAGRLDLDRVGMLGYSLGGAIAAEAAWGDSRIKSVVNMDGWLFAEAQSQGLDQPYLEMSDDSPLPQSDDLTATDPNRRYPAELDDRQVTWLATHLRSGDYLLTIAGTQHANFSDLPALLPVRRVTGAGPIAPARAVTVINAYTLSFFDQTLRGQSAPLLASGISPFGEANLRVGGASVPGN